MKQRHPNYSNTLSPAFLVRSHRYQPKRIALGLLSACIGLTAITREAKAEEEDTPSISVGIALGGFVSGSINTESREISGVGPAITLDYPLWLGARSDVFQWVLDANVSVIYGTDSNNARFSTGPQFGFTIDMGKSFGLELRQGISAVGHLGDDNHLAVALSTRGAIVFRAFADDQKSIKVQFIGQFSPFPEERNKGRQVPNSAGAVGLAYETPF